jgi:parallel beta-helix repeat protein
MKTIWPAVLTALIVTSPDIHAEYRTWVSSTGIDAGTCGMATPCRSFNYALLYTDSGGEIIAAESGSYDPVMVHKSVALIAAPNVHADILSVEYSNAITIDAGVAVIVRGFHLVPKAGPYTNGISLSSNAERSALTVENCLITDFTGNGLTIAAPGSRVLVKDTIFRNNHEGVHGDLSAPNMALNLNGVTVADSYESGLTLFGAGQVSISRSSVLGNGLYGVLAGAGAVVAISDSTIAQNQVGVTVDSGAFVSLSGNMIVNPYGISASGIGTKVVIEDNTITGRPTTKDEKVTGVHVSGGAFVSLSGNTISNNAFGIVTSDVSTNVVIAGNTITGNSAYGIWNSATNSATVLSVGNNMVLRNGALGTSDLFGVIKPRNPL